MPSFGEPTYGTKEWLQLPKKRGRKGFFKWLSLLDGVDQKALGKNPTAEDYIKAIFMQRHQNNSSSSSASQSIDPTHLLTTVADKIMHALNDTPCEIPCPNRLAIQYLAHVAGVNAQNSQLDSVRRMLIKIVTEMTKEAETAQLDLKPYLGDSACCDFLFGASKQAEITGLRRRSGTSKWR